MLSPRSLAGFAVAVSGALLARADLDLYVDDALASSTENWSWGSTINFAATDLFKGTSSISVASDAWSALSLKTAASFETYAGLRFDIVGDVASNLQLGFDATAGNGATAPTIAFAALGNFSTTTWTTVTVDFSQLAGSGTPLPNNTWDRIGFQALANGASYHIDNIALLTSIVIEPKFLSAEPLTSNTIAVTTQGAVDLSTVKVTLAGKAVTISSKTTTSPIDAPSKSITYLTLASNFAPGALIITAGNTTFNYTLPATIFGSVTAANTKAISPQIYGINWVPSASFFNATGVTLSRWGGNAITAYNPFKDVTNAGNDCGNADTWIGTTHASKAQAILTVPGLDWVSKDSTSYSFPKTVYPSKSLHLGDQAGFDPYKPDAGNGKDSSGNFVTPATDPNLSYEAWNTTQAQTWLKALKNVPEYAAVDNEIEIAYSTHYDMHPNPLGYDELLGRMVATATAIKTAQPQVKVFAPSVCNWWYYWTTGVGFSEWATHDSLDWLPWFLREMKKASTKAGKDIMDYLDIHYYQGAELGSGTADNKALYLRITRSWWDPDYIDESWVGTSEPQHHQPNPRQIWLIPRMKQLIAQYYPGLKLSLSEWSAMNYEQDVIGGLFVADSLGVFGVNGLDAATYWSWNTPSTSYPPALAYWLFRGYGTTFGDLSTQFSPSLGKVAWNNVNGFYSSKDSAGGKQSYVYINKDTKPVGIYISNIPTGTYFLRHFGGAAGLAKWQTQITIRSVEYLVIPAYTAVFFKQV
ncbi:glycoside hydrolase family 44-domain-containing protein [Auriculariales sp. MPI-PUGE-AT-0066]|nr:glycoside hydrolase family 44-domain-containing protein [Auriculariales sp. MPI-PUGE-AT-0066]